MSTTLSSTNLSFAQQKLIELNVEGYTSLVDAFDQSCAEFSARPAFHCLGQTLSYADIEGYSRKFGAFLSESCGLVRGDRIAIQLPNLNQFPIVVWGALRIGLTIVNTNPMYTAREQLHQFQDSGARALIILSDFVAAAEKVIPDTDIKLVVSTNVLDMIEAQPAAEYKLEKSVRVVTLPSAISLGEGKKLPQIRPTLNDLAVLQYTGGTTGVAKGAMLSHGNIIGSVAQSKKHFAEANTTNSGLLIAPLPIYHIFGFCVYLCSNFASGGRSVLIPDPRNLDGLLDVMIAFPFTGFASVNSMLVGLMNNKKFDQVDWSHLQWTGVGGAALVPDVAEQWERRTNTKLIEGYGLSETTGNLTLNMPSTRRIGTVGKPMGFQEIKLVNDAGQQVAEGEEGEVWVRGRKLCRGIGSVQRPLPRPLMLRAGFAPVMWVSWEPMVF